MLAATNDSDNDRLVAIVDDLLTLPEETEWVEFKSNNTDPDRMARTMAALANGAKLIDQPFGYMLWGIDNDTRLVIGTKFEPTSAKYNSQPLKLWLANSLSPSVNFSFFAVAHPLGRVILLKIPAASTVPVKYQNISYIRIGEATPKLSGYPERQAALLAKLRPFAWESGIAASFLRADEVLGELDWGSYFRLTEQRAPEESEKKLALLAQDRLISRDVGDRWNILNLGAMLFAVRLKNFDGIRRKAIRVIQYDGKSRTRTIKETEGTRGYAARFERLIDVLTDLLPSRESIGKALRTEHRMYPAIAIRELAANALIHQDMTITGAGPMIEIFDDRVEITNPGSPLIEPSRFMDLPPRSRNENLASLMRRMNICEERGSGIDKVIAAVELSQLPAPEFLSLGDNTKAILYGPRTFLAMDAAERVRACYWHAVLRYLTSNGMTNASLRARFGVAERNASQVSRVIGQAVEESLIKPSVPWNARTGYYLPIWA